MGEELRIYNLFPTLAGTTRKWAAHLPQIAAMEFDSLAGTAFAMLFAAGFGCGQTPGGIGWGGGPHAALRDYTNAAGRGISP